MVRLFKIKDATFYILVVRFMHLITLISYQDFVNEAALKFYMLAQSTENQGFNYFTHSLHPTDINLQQSFRTSVTV